MYFAAAWMSWRVDSVIAEPLIHEDILLQDMDIIEQSYASIAFLSSTPLSWPR